jgi:hypothetical protein
MSHRLTHFIPLEQPRPLSPKASKMPTSANGTFEVKMSINIADGKHSYDFEYTLPETQ